MTKPLVWIDCEMSGLDPSKDKLLEVALILTDDNLSILSKFEIIINQPDDVLDGMDLWCTTHHKESGLTEKVEESTTTQSEAELKIIEFIEKTTSKDELIVAGNTVHQDLIFIKLHMPKLAKKLHYRIIDVSSIKELCCRWYPTIFPRRPAKKLQHRALIDIEESIEELLFYRENVFRRRK